jgi:hypothetical protein
MDYLCVGSNGFAQVGQPDFRLKNKAEMAVLMEYLETQYPVPEEFSCMCCYRVKWFCHDFGNYSEIVMLYNDLILEVWQINDPGRAERFRSWFSKVESVDLGADAIIRLISLRLENMSCGLTKTPEDYEN